MVRILPRNDYSTHWERTHDWQIPLKPKFNLKCPVCGGKPRYKEYYPHHREYRKVGHQYRIDVWFKCTQCAYVWVHGVSITKDYYYEITEAMQKNIGRIRPLHILEVIDIEK